jgi:hypothetical protein
VRRRLLALVLLLPLSWGLAGCSGGREPSPGATKEGLEKIMKAQKEAMQKKMAEMKKTP